VGLLHGGSISIRRPLSKGNWKDDFFVIRRSRIQAGTFTVGAASHGLSSAQSKTKHEQVEKYPP
jgi:hypothetical protein